MIDAQALTRRFGAFTAVSQLSLHVPEGSVTALLGPNGAGKTTTVRMLAALLTPSTGEATVAGYDVRREPNAVRACIGLVTDVPGIYEQMTVTDYLNLFAGIYGLGREERARRIRELLEFFDLKPLRGQRMVTFSRGMKQKVALARALLHRPPVLFLDEPTAGLDPLVARSVRDLILSLKSARRSIVLCTHDLDEAERLADQVAIIVAGRIVACGSPEALRRQASGEMAVHIELAEAAALPLQALRTIEGLHTLEPAPGNRGLRFITSRPEHTNPLVLERLIAVGARVVSVNVDTTSLEDVYAGAVGSGRREERNNGV